MTDRHPLEIALNASADDIMSAVQRGFRTMVDVKGKQAEHFLEKQLAELRDSGGIDAFMWHDRDDQPDFEVVRSGRAYRMECKNVRSGPCSPKYPECRVELQKTRNSRDGTPTRAYRIEAFHVLAACLFNQTGRWEYLFAPVKSLARRPDNPELLAIMQPVPRSPQGPWSDKLLLALAQA